jgi:hypothetical protein
VVNFFASAAESAELAKKVGNRVNNIRVYKGSNKGISYPFL